MGWLGEVLFAVFGGRKPRSAGQPEDEEWLETCEQCGEYYDDCECDDCGDEDCGDEDCENW